MALQPSLRRPHGASLYLYATLLGLFSLHALTHYGLAFFLRGYTPGLITAVPVIPPCSGYIYRHLVPDALSVRAAVTSAAAGFLLFLPIVELAHIAAGAAG
jgi:hypothetical protein